MTEQPQPGRPLSAEDVAAGWQPWSGGPRPHAPSTYVEVRYRDGTEDHGQSAFGRWWHDKAEPERDIIAFRLSRPVFTPPAEGGEPREVLINRASYMVGNPSAWENYDEKASEVIRSLVAALSPAPASGGAVEALIADIDAEMEGRARGYADKRGELLFRCRDALAASPQPGVGEAVKATEYTCNESGGGPLHTFRFSEVEGVSNEDCYSDEKRIHLKSGRSLRLRMSDYERVWAAIAPASPSAQPAEEGALREAAEALLFALSPLTFAGKPLASLDSKLAKAINDLVPILAATRPQHDEVAK